MKFITEYFTQDKIDMIIEIVRNMGFIGGILLPVIEAFFPMLPLVLFVTINITAFGFFKGYLYSWIGNCLGSFLLFILIKKIGEGKISKEIEKSKYKNLLKKINEKDFTILFFLYCFPFTPSFLVSGSAALAGIRKRHFIYAIIPSKFLMMLSLAFIGLNINSFLDNPWKSVAFISIILVINYVINVVIKYYDKKIEK